MDAAFSVLDAMVSLILSALTICNGKGLRFGWPALEVDTILGGYLSIDSSSYNKRTNSNVADCLLDLTDLSWR